MRTGSSWNYIKLAKSEFDVYLPTSYPAGGKIYDINDTPDNKTFSFTWGSYFEEKLLVISTKQRRKWREPNLAWILSKCFERASSNE